MVKKTPAEVAVAKLEKQAKVGQLAVAKVEKQAGQLVAKEGKSKWANDERRDSKVASRRFNYNLKLASEDAQKTYQSLSLKLKQKFRDGWSQDPSWQFSQVLKNVSYSKSDTSHSP